MARALDATVAAPRMRANLLGVFAAVAMLLAAIGVYGVVAYVVGQRTHEIGVRRALGAKTADVLVMLVREALRPVLFGIVIGVAGALGLTRGLAAMLFGVTATDVATYVVACAVLGAAAAVASIVPARRALRIDPLAAVRSQ
jgi:putative ABC transport system permease protein